MMATAHLHDEVSPASIAVPAMLVLALSAALLSEAVVLSDGAPARPELAPQTVTIPARTFEHRLDGEYYRNGFAVDAPEVPVTVPALEIMKYQVTAAAYDECVASAACPPREPGHLPDGSAAEVPATGVSYDDAVAYAGWLSKNTGQTYTLPTDAEWASAAAESFVDDAFGIDADNRNPALRWLADYDRETARKAPADPAPKPLGSYGTNSLGVADLAGNVWEWTSTCQKRVDLAGAAAVAKDTCGIYVVEGRHRTPLTSFVRDPKTGGCSVGAPPDNLGFRLVKRPTWHETGLQRAFVPRLDYGELFTGSEPPQLGSSPLPL